MNIRLDNELRDRIKNITQQTPSKNRSAVVRSLLYQATGDDAKVAALIEVRYEWSSIQRQVVTRLSARVSELLPGIIEEVLIDNGLAPD